MFGVTDIWTYVIAVVLIILLPGPNSLYVLSVSARKGVRSGYQAAVAVLCGDGALMVASAAGVASLLRTSPTLFSIVKYAGAAYLAYLGWGLLRAALRTWRRRRDASDAKPQPAPAPGVERPFRHALIASLLNPKAILFFVAFFVQFVDPAYPYPVLSFLVLGTIAQVCSIVYLSTLIFSGNALANAFRARRRLAAAGTGAVGAVMVGFAAKLAAGGA
ncbi:MAG: leucine efflux protein LeuE [Stackebrandtia sp.]